MEKLRILGSCFVLSVGILIIITVPLMFWKDPVTYKWIVGFSFGALALLGGILGFASKQIAGGVLAVILATIYILIIVISLFVDSNGFYQFPLSFFLYEWDFGIIFSEHLIIPIEAILIIVGGIFLLQNQKTTA